MDLARVADDQSLLDPNFNHLLLRRIINALILDFKCLFEILESVSKFFGLSEKTSIIVVSDGSNPGAVFAFRIKFSLLK